MKDAPLNKNLKKWLIIIFIVAVVIIIGVDLWMYFAKTGLFATYKAQPGPPGSRYPNGEPDPATGKPKNAKQLSSSVQQILQNNLTNYQKTAAGEWGPTLV